MKTRIKKIIIMAVALLFVSVGVSFAHDVKVNSKRAPGNVYGHYKKGYDYHPGWYIRHPEPRCNFRDRYRYDRHAPHGKAIIGFKANEPDYKIVVVVKDRR